MMEDWRVMTVHELCEWIPEISKSPIGNVAAELYNKGIRKMSQCMQKCIIATVITWAVTLVLATMLCKQNQTELTVVTSATC